jgi:hypothetical protein
VRRPRGNPTTDGTSPGSKPPARASTAEAVGASWTSRVISGRPSCWRHPSRKVARDAPHRGRWGRRERCGRSALKHRPLSLSKGCAHRERLEPWPSLAGMCAQQNGTRLRPLLNKQNYITNHFAGPRICVRLEQPKPAATASSIAREEKRQPTSVVATVRSALGLKTTWAVVDRVGRCRAACGATGERCSCVA